MPCGVWHAAARRFTEWRPRHEERLTPEHLRLLSASHPIKVQLAQQLRREPTMDLKWISPELAVASWKYLSNPLSRKQYIFGQGELMLLTP